MLHRAVGKAFTKIIPTLTPQTLKIGAPVTIGWLDASTPSESWVALPYEPQCGQMVTRGFVAGSNTEALAVTHTITGQPSGADPISIPWGCIQSLVLDNPEEDVVES